MSDDSPETPTPNKIPNKPALQISLSSALVAFSNLITEPQLRNACAFLSPIGGYAIAFAIRFGFESFKRSQAIKATESIIKKKEEQLANERQRTNGGKTSNRCKQLDRELINLHKRVEELKMKEIDITLE